MPYREIDTGYWSDPFIEPLCSNAKLLYLYLWTNPHCNAAGLYEITPSRIAYETGLPHDSLAALLQSLAPKVTWYQEYNLIWVRNFIKRQSKSPKFLIAVAKSLGTIHYNGAVAELLQYNLERYTLSIPYPYEGATPPIPAYAVTAAVSKVKAVADTEKPAPKPLADVPVPPARAEAMPASNPEAVAVKFVTVPPWLQTLQAFRPFTCPDKWATEMELAFPDIDLEGAAKHFVDYWSERKKEIKSMKSTWRNWLIKAREMGKNLKPQPEKEWNPRG